VFVGEGGDIAFALPAPSTPPQGLTLFRTTRQRWKSTPVPASGGYASLAGSGGHLFLAYVDAANGYRRDINSVFVIRSGDKGVTWTPPVLVSRSGARGAYELHLVSLPDGSLHLVWVQDTGNGSSVLRHVSSSNAGSNWSAAQDLPISAPPGMASLAVSSDQCGGIHVLYEDWQKGAEDRHLDYAHWRAGWSVPQHLFPEYRAGDAALKEIKGGRVLVVFLAQRAGSKPSSPTWTLYSEGTSVLAAASTHARQ
jgi:hypothetical protein